MAKQAEEFMDTPLSEMTEEELMDYIRTVRGSRATPKASSPKQKALVKKSKSKVSRISKLTDGMSDEELEAFKAMLLKGD